MWSVLSNFRGLDDLSLKDSISKIKFLIFKEDQRKGLGASVIVFFVVQSQLFCWVLQEYLKIHYIRDILPSSESKF